MSDGLGVGIFTSFINWLYSSGGISIPEEFHERCKKIQELLNNDVTGVINTIVDYEINSATETDYTIECANDNLQALLNAWLSEINLNIQGVPTGLKELSKECFKEMWQASSFCVLRVSGWKKITVANNTLEVPTKMWFVNGSSVYVKRPTKENYKIGSDKYYLDENTKHEIPSTQEEEIVIYKPFARWFDEYPVPYLVRTGVLKNALALKILAEKSDEVITKVLPYLFLMIKGTEKLFLEGTDYKDKELQEMVTKFKEEISKFENQRGKLPVAGIPFDSKYEHLIPDLRKILAEELYRQGYRALLAGLGFIDVIQGISNTRKESVLNPAPFIAGVNSGVSGFKTILSDVIKLIAERNKKSVKLFSENNPITIVNTPLKINVDALLEQIRSAFDRGDLSIKTYIESLGFNYKVEREQRIKELESGDEDLFYPHLIQNREDVPDRFAPSKPRNNEKLENQGKKKGTPESKNFQAQIEEAESKYIRIRQKDPDDFEKDSFKIIWISKSKGIKAVIGKLKGETKTTIQSYLFDKTKWSEEEAKKWVKEHDGKVEAALEYILDTIEEASNELMVICKKCKHEFDYLSIPEAGMGYVKCPNCEENINQNGEYATVINEPIDPNLEIAPYKNINELPSHIKKMTKHCQEVFMATFNSVYQETNDEGKSFAIATAAARRCMKKQGYHYDKDSKTWKKAQEN
jgi:cation transport regulator ChaB